MSLIVQFKSGLFADLSHGKNSFRWFRFLLLRGTAESGALKANALPGAGPSAGRAEARVVVWIIQHGLTYEV
jgi:hypothetical protein